MRLNQPANLFGHLHECTYAHAPNLCMSSESVPVPISTIIGRRWKLINLVGAISQINLASRQTDLFYFRYILGRFLDTLCTTVSLLPRVQIPCMH